MAGCHPFEAQWRTRHHQGAHRGVFERAEKPGCGEVRIVLEVSKAIQAGGRNVEAIAGRQPVAGAAHGDALGSQGIQRIDVAGAGVITLIEGPLGSRAAAVKFAPAFAVYFLFILLSNVTALVPLVGPALTMMVDGVNTPVLRPFTADLNGAIALAVIAIIMVQVMSIREQGGKNHLKHYFSDKPFNPINFFIGILEVFGEFTRVLSLSLRLFLNTAVGEILVSVFTSLILAGGRTPLAVLPILLFEILVAGIQAYVFTVLAATYLGLATAHHREHGEHQGEGLESTVGDTDNVNNSTLKLSTAHDDSSIKTVEGTGNHRE